jgi:hypothetical protein
MRDAKIILDKRGHSRRLFKENGVIERVGLVTAVTGQTALFSWSECPKESLTASSNWKEFTN